MRHESADKTYSAEDIGAEIFITPETWRRWSRRGWTPRALVRAGRWNRISAHEYGAWLLAVAEARKATGKPWLRHPEAGSWHDLAEVLALREGVFVGGGHPQTKWDEAAPGEAA